MDHLTPLTIASALGSLDIGLFAIFSFFCAYRRSAESVSPSESILRNCNQISEDSMKGDGEGTHPLEEVSEDSNPSSDRSPLEVIESFSLSAGRAGSLSTGLIQILGEGRVDGVVCVGSS